MRPSELRQRNGRLLLALLAGAFILLAGCDLGAGSQPPSASCSEAGVQCQLPAGPIGVCERSQCPAGRSEPCFECVSQH